MTSTCAFCGVNSKDLDEPLAEHHQRCIPLEDRRNGVGA